MARKTNKAAIASRENPAAPFLFDEDQLPVRADVVEAIVQRRYESTGARILDSDIQAARMVELLCMGNGAKRVARIMGVSPHSVRAARRALESQGKIAPFKERFQRMAEEVIEEGTRGVLEAILDGRMHPHFMGSTTGIFFDKRALSMGEPTAISVGATAQLKAEDLSLQRLNAWLEALPTEGESIGKPPVPAQTGSETALVTTSAPDRDRPNPDVQPSAAADPNHGASPAQGGGGVGGGGGHG
jgi:hypothetical protein